jgi:hypothetical protein
VARESAPERVWRYPSVVTFDRWIALIGVIVGVLGIAVGAGFSMWSIRVSRRIARESGTDKAPALKVGFGNVVLMTQKTLRVAFGVDRTDHRLRILALPLRFANVGGRALEGITVEVVLPVGIETDDFNIVSFGFMPGEARSRTKIGERTHSYYYLPSIPPGRTIAIDEPFFGEPTVDVKWRLPVAEARATADLTVSYLLAFDVIVSGRELLPHVIRIEVAVVGATDFTALARACQETTLNGKPSTKVQRFFRRRAALSLPGMILALPTFKAVKTAAADSKAAGHSPELLLQDVNQTRCVWFYPSAGFYVESGKLHWLPKDVKSGEL